MRFTCLPLTLAFLSSLAPASASPDEANPVAYETPFWKRWGDGKAEVAGYELTFKRYGQARKGTAVAIFVTETFANGVRVKSDGGRPDEFPVIKLNLAQDFQTGLYDYHLMTSAFVALKAVNGAAPGYPTKVSVSAQEWCGHVYQQVLFDKGSVRDVLHSYFDGEADRTGTLERPGGGLSEDALLLWARGLASPRLAPGATVTAPVLTSLVRARLEHRPLAWSEVTLAREAKAQTIKVPAGAFEVDVLTAAIKGGPRWTFFVERAQPRRVIRWETDSGQRADLVGVKRLAYWQLSGNGNEKLLREIGLTPRAPRTP